VSHPIYGGEKETCYQLPGKARDQSENISEIREKSNRGGGGKLPGKDLRGRRSLISGHGKRGTWRQKPGKKKTGRRFVRNA